MQKCIAFFKKETILCISGILALCSMCIIPPDAAYIDYLNTQVLVLLFCLMAVMAGLQELGIFQSVAYALLKRTGDLRQLSLVLVLLCFFFAMLVTNDVALITFVPFTILLLRMAKLSTQMIPLLVLQTIAANLGSMLTPIGNPQNLYLYTISGISPWEFILTMLPLTLLSLFLLVVCCLQIQDTPLAAEVVASQRSEQMQAKQKITLSVLLAIFAACLLTVFHVLPYTTALMIALVWFVLFSRKVLLRVDYSLLVTFVFFFIFIGNLGRIPAMQEAISSILEGRELFVSFLLSQVVSNVPAAVLLSGFTTEWKGLLFGVNIGGLGTLIASMASLISYKFFVQEVPEAKGKYLKDFTKMNLIFAAVLLITAVML